LISKVSALDWRPVNKANIDKRPTGMAFDKGIL